MTKRRVLTLLGFALLIIGIGLATFSDSLAKNRVTKVANLSDKIGQVAHYTRAEMNKIPELLSNKQYLAPTIDHESLQQEIPGAKVYDETTGQVVKMDVWDSWPVTNPDGTVADFHGYRLVVGLTAKNGRYSGAPTKMGLFLQKNNAKQDDLSTWHFVGYVFNSKTEGIADKDYDKYLQNAVGEWSGSTVLMKNKDNSLRIFYANAYQENSVAGQTLTTAQITVSPKDGKTWSSGLVIDHTKTTDRKTVFSGDGKIYQTAEQGEGKGKYISDDITLRDPHFVQDGDKYYLAFEGNTGPEYNYQGANNFTNQAYYGTSAFFKSDSMRLQSNRDTTEYEKTYFANGAIGKVE